MPNISPYLGDAYSKALALHTEAVALYDQPRRFGEAARLHVREAHFRSPRDAEAVEALAMAGRLFRPWSGPVIAR